MGYTNAIPQLVHNVLSVEDGCRSDEIAAVIDISETSVEVLGFVQSVMTNSNAISQSDRQASLVAFGQKVLADVAASRLDSAGLQSVAALCYAVRMDSSGDGIVLRGQSLSKFPRACPLG